MVFASYEFVFVFLPIVIVVYYLLSRFTRLFVMQHIFLVFASLYFYAYFNFSYIKIIIGSILINYICARVLAHEKKEQPLGGNLGKKGEGRKIILVLGVLFNVLLLGYYKYYDFFITNINNAFNTHFALHRILLPLGISFFTFQQLSFLIAIYNKSEKLGSFTDYCLFVTFFPQLVAGPIVLYSEMMPQFSDARRRSLNLENFSKGMFIFVMGLFKKIVVADSVALFVNNGFALPSLGFGLAWATSLSYTLQLYFDFSGYSDMAIGMGKMFNIDLPVNFNSPYKSKSVTEFWRRWHITLGRALSTFIYIPLGGNRKGLKRTLFNLLIVFFVSGLWHGADWTFIIWGMFHGAMVLVERNVGEKLEQIPNIFRLAFTFLYVNALWVLFRAENFAEAMKIYRGMLDFGNWDISSISSLAMDGIVNFPVKVGVVYVFALLLFLYMVVFITQNSIKQAELFERNCVTAFFTSALFVLSTIHMSRLSVFIYFNF